MKTDKIPKPTKATNYNLGIIIIFILITILFLVSFANSSLKDVIFNKEEPDRTVNSN